MRIRWATMVIAVAAAFTTAVAVSPAQAATLSGGPSIQAVCSSSLQTQVPERSGWAVRGRVYLKSDGYACAYKRIIVYVQIHDGNGWSNLLMGLHYVPSDEFGWTLVSGWQYTPCGWVARSVYRQYYNDQGTGGYQEVYGGAYQMFC